MCKCGARNPGTQAVGLMIIGWFASMNHFGWLHPL
jgi:hypothetical protein